MKNTISGIIQIASKVCGLEEIKLNRETRISSDLRIEGDDVWNLLLEVDKKYTLNFEGFSFEKYFNPESAVNPLKSIFKKVLGNSKDMIQYEITLGDIEEWVNNGIWKEHQK